jgi:hypothetical protein
MDRLENLFKPLTWFMAILLTAFLAGCGDGIAKGAGSPATPGISLGDADPSVANIDVPYLRYAVYKNQGTGASMSIDTTTVSSASAVWIF